jgi:hypothetical protein
MIDLMRREYLFKVLVNGRPLKVVVVDSHYEAKHSKTMNDQLILKLVKTLEGTEHRPESITSSGFEIYVTDPAYFEDKPYRLVWTLHPDENYLGVVNAFRRSHAKISK